MRRVFCLIAIFIGSLSPCWGFNVTSALDKSEKVASLTLWGAIEAGDDLKFRDTVTRLLKDGYLIDNVHIFSHGGDVKTAMNVGNQIRTLQATTVTAYSDNPYNVAASGAQCTVPQEQDGRLTTARLTRGPECTCESACFLIWASGAQRMGTRIGIHRFYWKGPEFGNLAPSAARELYQRNEVEYREYVQKLNVPQQIVDRLFATGSQEMYFLNPDELRLIERTPYLEEMENSRCGPVTAAVVNNSINPAYIHCTRSILEQLHREGANAYLAGGTANAVTR